MLACHNIYHALVLKSTRAQIHLILDISLWQKYFRNYPGRVGSRKRGKKRMTTQSRLQSRQKRKPLFAQGRQIATNTAKSLCACQTAEAARDLLLHFDHAQIPLGQIVVKIHPQIFQEAEDRFLMVTQTVEQIACGTLFDPPLGPRRGRRSWSDLITFIKQA